MLFLLSVLSASAANLLYLPGDAFFSAVLPQTGLTAADGVLALSYHHVSRGMMGCGDAGYKNLRIEGVSELLLDNLRAAHNRALQPPPTGGVAASVLVLVVDASFDPTRLTLAARYNEDLYEELLSTGHQLERSQFAAPPPEEARLSEEVPGLPLTQPLPDRRTMDAVAEPVVAPRAGVRFLVTTDASVFNLRDGAGDAAVWVVDEQGITEHTLQ